MTESEQRSLNPSLYKDAILAEVLRGISLERNTNKLFVIDFYDLIINDGVAAVKMVDGLVQKLETSKLL